MALFPHFGTSIPAKVAKAAKVEPIAHRERRNFRKFRNFRSLAGRQFREVPPAETDALVLLDDLADADADAYAERIAICTEAGDVEEDAAHRTATAQCGASLDELAARQIASWRHRIEALPEPADRRLAGIKATCIEALAQRWAHDAARLGWDECEMFGLDPATPTNRDLNGLLLGLALTSLRLPVRVVEIRASEAVIETGTGSRLRHFNTGRAGPPIWEHPAFWWMH